MTDDTELREAMRTVRGTWRVWLLLLATIGLAGFGLQQLYRDRETALADLQKSDARATEKQAELIALEQAKNEAEKESKRLIDENKALQPIKDREEARAKEKEAKKAALEALKTAVGDKWKEDLPKGVKVLAGNDRLRIELADKLFFDGDAAALSKHGTEAMTALAAAIQEAKAAKVRVLAHGELIGAANDKAKLLAHDRAAAIAKLVHEKTKGVEVEVALPLAKNDRRHLEVEVPFE